MDNEALAAPRGDISVCDYCGIEFTPYRPQQRFCCNNHRRAFETIVNRVSSKLRPEIRRGLRDMMAAKKNDPES